MNMSTDFLLIDRSSESAMDETRIFSSDFESFIEQSLMFLELLISSLLFFFLSKYIVVKREQQCR